ncbi:MAG: hypothetical protein U1F25_07350 [Rubrivivax sp.]
MDASFHIVGCVLAARPAGEQIDAFVAQARRERAAVLVRSAQSATFVRFHATDAKLVSMACRALRDSGAAALLRFGFAAGQKEVSAAAPEGLDISTQSVVQAGDLAAGAADGEVLVSPQLAAVLVEAGFALRSKKVALPGGRSLAACVLELGDAREAAQAPLRSRAKKPAAAARESPGLAPLAAVELPEPEPPTPQRADALAGVFAALLEQAEEVARRQAELELRQDAVLGKMTLADEGHVSARHLAEMEGELDAQLVRVQDRLDFIDRLEQRVGNLQAVVADVERRLSAQLSRRSEVESLKALADALVEQMVQAHQRLEDVAAVQQRLLPVAAQAAALAGTLEASQQAVNAFEGRLAALGQGTGAMESKLDALAERGALLASLRTEIDALREVGERSRADVQFVSEREAALAALRSQVEDLAGRAADTDGKLAGIEARRAVVEEVKSHTDTITHLLGDIQLKLEILGEQRSEIDHVGGQLARLDFTLQEAQNTLRALQREREVAERIEQGLKALRARTSAAPSV